MARTEYVSLAELKAFITMDTAVVDRDAQLTIALDAAHEAVEDDCGRRFWLDGAATARTYDTVGRTVAEPGGELLLIDDAGAVPTLVEVGSMGTFATVTGTIAYAPENAAARGRAITGLRLVAGTWATSPYAQVRVTARWGWPAVPARVKQATLLQAARLYERRNSPQGVAGMAEWGAVRVTKTDPDVFAMLDGLTLPGFG